jgi:COMPASS component SWD2
MNSKHSQSSTTIFVFLSIYTLHSHHEDCLLFAGMGNPTQPSGLRNAVNYLSVYDNKILRKFRGHSSRVTGLSQCPADDSFLSTSEDGTIRLWDLKSAGCLAECKLPRVETHVTPLTPPLAVFDSTGLVFGVAAQMSPDQGGFFLNLYDARNHSAGPFADLKINQGDLVVAIQQAGASIVQAEQLSRNPWSNHGAFMKFNTKGDQILVGGNDGMVILLDGFGGAIQRVWMTGNNSTSSTGSSNTNNAVACFSSDDQCVLAAGSDPGTIDVFTSDKTGSKIKRLEGQHADGNITCIASNPVYSQFASSSKDTALWIWDGVPR